MPKSLHDLINGRITGIQRTHDYWSITTDECGINIYNPVKCCLRFNEYRELQHMLIDDIIGHVIVDVDYEESHHLNFKLDNNCIIMISLVSEEYIGPEAASMHFSSGETLVVQE